MGYTEPSKETFERCPRTFSVSGEIFLGGRYYGETPLPIEHSYHIETAHPSIRYITLFLSTIDPALMFYLVFRCQHTSTRSIYRQLLLHALKPDRVFHSVPAAVRTKIQPDFLQQHINRYLPAEQKIMEHPKSHGLHISKTPVSPGTLASTTFQIFLKFVTEANLPPDHR